MNVNELFYLLVTAAADSFPPFNFLQQSHLLINDFQLAMFYSKYNKLAFNTTKTKVNFIFH